MRYLNGAEHMYMVTHLYTATFFTVDKFSFHVLRVFVHMFIDQFMVVCLLSEEHISYIKCVYRTVLPSRLDRRAGNENRI